VEADKSISVMLHPSDDKTGVHYSILPMERGILSGIFTKEQADYHQDIIEKRLKGPDGARLMDRPLNTGAVSRRSFSGPRAVRFSAVRSG
jgi:1,2-beta-oligoglucan phosphorylase